MNGHSGLSSFIEASHQRKFDCRERYLRIKRLSAPRDDSTGQNSDLGR